MSRFKASNGKYYTRQLFWEEWVDMPIDQRVGDPPFSLLKDRPGKINFGKRYVALRDPTGYKVSQELLEDYSLWTTLMSCRWFIAAKEIWDRELDACLRSEGLDIIRLLAKEGLPAQQLAAGKYLANADYKPKTSAKGRPRREDVDRAAKELAASDREIAEDLLRIQSA